MADNYAQFSETIEIPREAEAWLKEVLSADHHGTEDEEYEAFCKDLGVEDIEVDCWPGFDWDVSKGEFWFYSDEGIDEESLTIVLQALLRKFMPDDLITVTIALTCSQMRAGDFGGAWLVISKDDVQGGHTHEAAKKTAEEMRERMNNAGD